MSGLHKNIKMAHIAEYNSQNTITQKGKSYLNNWKHKQTSCRITRTLIVAE